MYKINSCEFNYVYNDRVFLPYSVATLVSHVKTNPKINENFHFEKTFISRSKVDEYIQRCQDSDILLCSCYVWNWEITTYLAKKVKELNPNCLMIFGGPQTPDLAEGFFEKYSFVDIIVHGEGENTLEEILESFQDKKDYSKIDGLETKDFATPMRARMNDLNTVPSPYLNNLIWDLTEKTDGQKFMAIWETNRGCPYQCTFCDWGSLTYTKLRNYSDDRLFKEIEWFADNKIEFVHCADANFGILDNVQKFYEKMYNVSFIQFYEGFYDFCNSEKSIFSNEYDLMVKHTENGINGDGWSYFDEKLGEIYWAIEEGTWLHLVEKGTDLKNDINAFLNFFEQKNQLNTNKSLISDLVNFQVFLLTTRDDSREIKQMTFENYWHEYFQSDLPLKNEQISYFFKNPVQENDYVKWGFESIWWGRAQRKFKSDPDSIEILENKPIAS
ncbi:MAG: cobalamin B12-binding domain-containing protein [Pelagibacterales bacterium]|nr:cobalamin B12-binding domain-containing protein [Pelagibacterales bacterium]